MSPGLRANCVVRGSKPELVLTGDSVISLVVSFVVSLIVSSVVSAVVEMKSIAVVFSSLVFVVVEGIVVVDDDAVDTGVEVFT